MAGLTYARFFPTDWKSGTIGQLNLEEEGLYIRCCVWMWDSGQPVPGNDRVAASLLHVQVQKYIKVMSALIEKGKMIRAQGVIINDRVMRDIDEFRGKKELRADRAKAGHEHRRISAEKIALLEAEIAKLKDQQAERQSTTPPHQPPGQPPHQPPPGSPGGTPPTPPTHQCELSNKINEEKMQVQSNCSAKPEARSQKPEKKKEEEAEALELEPVSGREFWSKAMAVPGRNPSDHKVRMENGKLELLNGFKSEWLERFGGDIERLDLAVISAAAYVQPFGLKPLDVQVSAQLARQLSEKRDRDDRFAANASRGARGKRQSIDENEAQRVARLMQRGHSAKELSGE